MGCCCCSDQLGPASDQNDAPAWSLCCRETQGAPYGWLWAGVLYFAPALGVRILGCRQLFNIGTSVKFIGIPKNESTALGSLPARYKFDPKCVRLEVSCTAGCASTGILTRTGGVLLCQCQFFSVSTHEKSGESAQSERSLGSRICKGLYSCSRASIGGFDGRFGQSHAEQGGDFVPDRLDLLDWLVPDAHGRRGMRREP